MVLTEAKLTDNATAVVAEYGTVGEYARDLGRSEYAKKRTDKDVKWAGATTEIFMEYATKGNMKYAREAEKYVDHFTNVAIADYDLDFEYNTEVGVLDYQAALYGDPACMYGLAPTMTDRAPLAVYMDCWTSCTIPTHMMRRRGIAVLALVQALSIFRPVKFKIVTGLHHMPSRTDVVQLVDVPTAPMDLGRAAWMIAAPEFFRVGLLPMVWHFAKDLRPCGVPVLSPGMKWQSTQLGAWAAKRDEVNEFLFMSLMCGDASIADWKTDEAALGWVKRRLAEYMPESTKINA